MLDCWLAPPIAREDWGWNYGLIIEEANVARPDLSRDRGRKSNYSINFLVICIESLTSSIDLLDQEEHHVLHFVGLFPAHSE